MKAVALAAALMMVAAFTACSGEYPLNGEKSAVKTNGTVTAGKIDPDIPAVVITARRMSAAEKRAYDQESNRLITGLQSPRQP